MLAILLDEQQSSIVSQSRSAVQVRDAAGKVLGRIVSSANSTEPFADHWVQCWEEWRLAAEETDED